MSNWTTLSAVILVAALTVSVAEARTVRYGGGCPNGQCGMATASEVATQAQTDTTNVTTTAAAEATKATPDAGTKVETTKNTNTAPAVAPAPQRRGARFTWLRRSWR